jgi:cytochrome c
MVPAGGRIDMKLMISLGSSIFILATLGGCGRPTAIVEPNSSIVGGDPERGKSAMRQYGCVACHTIPGIDGADGVVGPPLTKMARRTFVAGVLTNTPDNLQRWIQDPPAVDEKTAMPNLHIQSNDVRDIATYLYTLK